MDVRKWQIALLNQIDRLTFSCLLLRKSNSNHEPLDSWQREEDVSHINNTDNNLYAKISHFDLLR